jgi:REP element-mobilizing transposase RayT
MLNPYGGGLQNRYQQIIPRSIGAIVRGFKIGVTKWFRQNTSIHTVWQHNYFEHIIRNHASYLKITEYIHNNPVTWREDKYYEQSSRQPDRLPALYLD